MTERIGADGPVGDLDQTRTARVAPVARGEGGLAREASPAPTGDRIDISAQAVCIHRARLAVGAAPETRPALVERLQREIADGTYRVDSRALAARLLPVLFPDRFSH